MEPLSRCYSKTANHIKISICKFNLRYENSRGSKSMEEWQVLAKFDTSLQVSITKEFMGYALSPILNNWSPSW